VTEVGCLAHARRKFFDLHAANKSQIAEFALQQFARVYDIEREVRELDATQRRDIRRRQTQPVLDALHEWMRLQRQKVLDGSAIAKALDYNLRRWEALTRFVDDGQLPLDNNWIENRGCAEFCVNGQSTVGASRLVRKHNDIQDGELPIEVPRDRHGSFEPQLIPKHQTRWGGFDDKIISLYARGMTVREIQAHLQEMYGTEVSPSLISSVTDAVSDEVKAWQARPLDPIYPNARLDCIHVKVREGAVRVKAVYLGYLKPEEADQESRPVPQ